MTLLEEIKSALIHDQIDEALKQINRLNRQELETQGPGSEGYLFDFATRHSNNLSVLHALINRYAVLTRNKHLTPLTIDINPLFFTKLDELFIMGHLPIMKHASLRQYKDMLSFQKIAYCHRVFDEVKKLSIHGGKLLLEVLKEPQKAAVEKAIIDYQKNYINHKSFYQIINACECLHSESLAVQKAKAIEHMARELFTLTDQFLTKDSQSLTSYQTIAKNIVYSRQALVQSCRGLGKIVTDIGNAIARYSGIGLVASFSQGKVREFMAGSWTLFAMKPTTQQQQENILNALDTLPVINV